MKTESRGAEGIAAASRWHGALLLAGFAFVCTTVVATTYSLTRDKIAANEHELLMQRFAPVMSPLHYDQIRLEQPLHVSKPGVLPGDGDAVIYPVLLNQDTVGFAILVTTIGYSGAIEILIGVDLNPAITGVRVLRHSETPGLGDKIDTARSDWILTFEGRSLEDPPPARWALSKNGGEFDQFTGASITPRAVIRAVRDTLIYFDRHRAELVNAANKS